MNKSFDVTATNGKITRTERVNTTKNKLFENCNNSEDIKKIYEIFWLNEIKVLNVVEV
jgi:hypothetical protein